MQLDKLEKDSAAERAILNLLGLFDRPADGPAVDALLARHIPGLTDELFFEKIETTSGIWPFRSQKIELKPIPEAKRALRLIEAKNRLRKLRLLSKANPRDPHELDAHPVVRAFFAGPLGETAPEAAKAAHEILYRHYAAAAPDLPDTLEEMQPLFHAVQHGVKAGFVREAYDEVIQRRINRRNDHFIVRVLGAYGPLLATSSPFFQTPWRTPLTQLLPEEQAFVLQGAAFALMALGRRSDSVEPRLASLDIYVAEKHWKDAAIVGRVLADTLLLLGRVAEAVRVAERGIMHSERSKIEEQLEFGRIGLACALTTSGNFENAAMLFAEAEEIHRRWHPSPQLMSHQGYRYGDLILASGDIAHALNRGRYILSLAEDYTRLGGPIVDLGFGHLLIGRAQAALGDGQAAASLDAGVASLRKSGRSDYLPLALLARAVHRRLRAAAGETDLIEGIRADLAEVEDIAGEEMRLYLTDLALERARLALDVPAAFDSPEAARGEAKAQTAKAAALIADTGYHRRDGELAELQARLAAPEPAH